MAKIPKRLERDPLIDYLADKGINLVSQGKVRNTFRLDARTLLVQATDRISIFDFVLNAEVPKKGEVLTALTHFWGNIFSCFPNHLCKSGYKQNYNAAYDLKKFNGLNIPLERLLVVEDLSGQMDTYELIFRAHIGGSVYAFYIETGLVAGQAIEPNLPEWSKLDYPIFTPSTKEENGHDINVDASVYFEAYGEKGKKFIKRSRVRVIFGKSLKFGDKSPRTDVEFGRDVLGSIISLKNLSVVD